MHDINVHLERWITESVNIMFRNSFNNNPYGPLLTESQTRLSNVARFELRQDGPFYRPGSKGFYDVKLELNMLIVAPTEPDLYLIDRMKGFARSCFPPCFPIFKLGVESYDTGAYIETFSIDPDVTNHAEPTVFDLGPVSKDRPLRQALVEVHYTMPYHTED